MWDPYKEFEKIVLPNGLTLYAAKWNRPWQNVNFVVHTGADEDPPGLEGLAHYVEHVISDNGSMTARKMEMFFEAFGGSVDFGGTAFPCTSFQFVAPADKKILDRSLAMFGSMLLDAQLERGITRERKVIIREFHEDFQTMAKFEGELRGHQNIFSGLWPERILSPLGSPESILQIGKADIQAFYDERYRPHNMSVVALGGIKPEDFAEMLAESPFGRASGGVRSRIPEPVSKFVPLSEYSHRHILPSDMPMSDRQQSASYLAMARLPGSVGSAASNVLGMMLNKQLHEKVRQENALTYSMECDWEDFRTCHRFAIKTDGLNPDALDGIDGIVSECVDSLSDDELFDWVYKQELNSYLMEDLTGDDICQIAVEDVGYCHRIITRTEHHRNMQALTQQHIVELIGWLQPENRWALTVQP